MADKSAFKKDWVLTGPALEMLLAALDAAGVGYLEMRNRVAKFFAYNRVADPDELIDITFDRAARRIAEGEEVRNPVSYITGIARFVLKEKWSGPNVNQIDDQELPDVMIDRRKEDENKRIALDRRLDCLEGCVATLTSAERERITDYYYDEKRAKINRRKQMAEELGVSLVNLRVRMHRTRRDLEKCVENCLGQTVGE